MDKSKLEPVKDKPVSSNSNLTFCKTATVLFEATAFPTVVKALSSSTLFTVKRIIISSLLYKYNNINKVCGFGG